MTLTEEHAMFIASGYTEARWLQVLENRRTWKLRQQALRDWANEQPETVPQIAEVKPVYKQAFTPRIQQKAPISKPIEKPNDTTMKILRTVEL